MKPDLKYLTQDIEYLNIHINTFQYVKEQIEPLLTELAPLTIPEAINKVKEKIKTYNDNYKKLTPSAENRYIGMAQMGIYRTLSSLVTDLEQQLEKENAEN
jgi:prefoldin subunit 5